MKELRIKLKTITRPFLVRYEQYSFCDKYLCVDNDLTIPLSRVEVITQLGEEDIEVYYDDKRTFREIP